MGANEWIISINNRLENLPDTSGESELWHKRSIYKIPASVTDLNSMAYKPQMVSIGPYHHGAGNTKAMEEHKARAFLHLLQRSNKPPQAYLEALAPVALDLQHAYDQLSPEWCDMDRFLEMMILDGCFILEIIRAALRQPDYAANDPIFSQHGRLYIVPYLKRDMLMIENQLPLLVLQRLDAVQEEFKDRKDVTKRILKFFQQNAQHELNDSLHILDIYRKRLLLEEPRPRPRKKPKDINGGADIIPSATELNEAGIRIKRSPSRCLKDISFRGGVLKLPMIVVDDALESLLLNLIAFERFHVGAGNDVTSYVFFMDNLVGGPADVGLLHSRGVIQNALGSDKAVPKLFHSITKDITLDPDSAFNEVHKQIAAYCRSPWRQWRADMVHRYFTDPWLIPAAAILLFILSILQTTFTVLAYFSPP